MSNFFLASEEPGSPLPRDYRSADPVSALVTGQIPDESFAVCELCGGPNPMVLRNGGRACMDCRRGLAGGVRINGLTSQQNRRLDYLSGAGRDLDAFNEGLLPPQTGGRPVLVRDDDEIDELALARMAGEGGRE